MVGAAPVCPPERPRSGVSIRKGHVPTRKSGVSIHKRCMLTPKHVCAFADGCAPAGRHGGAAAFPSAKGTSPPAKEPFPFINDACSHQNMFVHLPMNAPSWGDTGGHTGTAPTNLHQTSLPCNLLHLVHRRTIRRQSYDASHMRNGRGGACVPARTSAQRRFHQQRACSYT